MFLVLGGKLSKHPVKIRILGIIPPVFGYYASKSGVMLYEDREDSMVAHSVYNSESLTSFKEGIQVKCSLK